MRVNQSNIRLGGDRSDSQRWIVKSFALVVFCVSVFTQPAAADCWVKPWICTEQSIGCYHPDWMDSLDGNLLISEISIPGTHETMASHGTWMAKCQTVQDLREQLDAGIRALDIRCRHIDDRFAIHHASVYMEAWFGEPLHAGHQNVMQKCVQFLYDNPSEFLLMRIQPTFTEIRTTRTFAETFQWYITEDGCDILTNGGDSAISYRDFVWTSDSYLNGLPTVDTVRRRIVILQEFATRYLVGNGPRRVMAADLDNNGYKDLVTVIIGDDSLAILMNQGDMTFEKYHLSAPKQPYDVCAADFNQDGWLDIGAVGKTDNRFAWYINDSTDSFHPFEDR